MVMFLGIEYYVDGEPVRLSIDRSDLRVPVATRGGRCLMMFVGQGEPFVDASPGHYQGWPEGNTVTLEILRNPTGLWQKWRSGTRPVKIAVARYYCADALGYPKAHDLAPGQFLQGALLCKKLYERVYFVVVTAPGVGGRWLPRVVGANA